LRGVNLGESEGTTVQAEKVTPQLTKRVILLLDVLGFRELATGKEAQANLESLHSALADVHDFSTDDVKIYSDNALVCWSVREGRGEPIASEGPLGSSLLDAARFQFELTRRGFYTRGAITVGDIYMDEHLVFGPGLIDAYDLETKVAVHPRVVLSGGAVSLARQHLSMYALGSDSPHHWYILWGSDGRFFLNYLGWLFEDDREELIYQELLKHRDGVVTNLEKYAARPAIWEKYRWLASYHDFICQDAFPSRPELLVAGRAEVAFKFFTDKVRKPRRKRP
jgi:hypothetical protein